jgi:hypothetical protein
LPLATVAARSALLATAWKRSFTGLPVTASSLACTIRATATA